MSLWHDGTTLLRSATGLLDCEECPCDGGIVAVCEDCIGGLGPAEVDATIPNVGAGGCAAIGGTYRLVRTDAPVVWSPCIAPCCTWEYYFPDGGDFEGWILQLIVRPVGNEFKQLYLYDPDLNTCSWQEDTGSSSAVDCTDFSWTLPFAGCGLLQDCGAFLPGTQPDATVVSV